MSISIFYNSEGYPIKRMILQKTDNKYIKVSKAWDLKLILMYIISKVFHNIMKDNYYNRLVFTYKPIKKFKGIVHTFNSIYIGKSPWVCTIEYMFPAAYYKMTKDKYEIYLLKMSRYIIKDNCIKLMPMSQFSKKRILNDIYSYLPQNEADIIARKVVIMRPPQEALITTCGIISKFEFIDRITFCFVGRDFWRKGGYSSYKALKKLRKRYNNFKLIIVSSLNDDGGWYVFEKENIENELISSDFVEWYRELDNSKVIELLKKSHVGLLPTWGDTYGFSVLEMQACGVPCITTNSYALSEINNNECGWIIDKHYEIRENDLEIRLGNQDDMIETLYDMIERNILGESAIFNEIQKKALESLKRIKVDHNPSNYKNNLDAIYNEANGS